MNKFIGIGRMTRDPEVRVGESTVARFSIAVDRKFKRDGEPTADFINCVAFGKTAEFIEKYFRKGMKMALVGRLQTGSYTNKDGQKVYTTDVVVEECEFAESKQNESNQNVKDEQIGDGFMKIPDGLEEDLPFN